MPKLAFGPKVAAWMKAEGLNAFRAQPRLGATDTTISNWIAGAVLPPSTRVPAIAKAMGIPVAELAAMIARDRRSRGRRSLASVRRSSHAKKATAQVRA